MPPLFRSCCGSAAAAQVARLLINMHNQVAAGDFSYVEQMRAAQAQAQVGRMPGQQLPVTSPWSRWQLGQWSVASAGGRIRGQHAVCNCIHDAHV